MVTVVVGGQTGSEAKGKASVHLVKRQGCALAVRTGGCNAGHTVYIGNQKYVTRQLPSALAIPGVPLAIGAGGMVDINLLQREIEELSLLGVNIADRLTIDSEAAIVEDNAGEMEGKELGLGTRIGSTQTGVGWTQSQRMIRKARVARESGLLTRWIGDVATMANKLVDQGKHVIIEGTQGFGLSMYHSRMYPFVTSRCCTASGFASEVGIAPSLVTKVVMVIRTYPIRVGGNSGPMKDEITWQEVQRRSGATEPIVEMTSVTKRVRRVSEFDWDMFDRACMINRPTGIMVHGLDYLNVKDKGVRTGENWLSEESVTFLKNIESRVNVLAAFTGPHQDDVWDFEQRLQETT